MLSRFLLARAGLGLALALLCPLSSPAQPSLTPDKSAAGRLPEYDYSAIDKWAKAAPKEAEQSVRALGAYLAKGAKNDREKARAVFTWMVENLAYDWDGLARVGKDDPRPEVVLKTRLAACGGFSSLYEALAKTTGLKCVTVPGRVRELDIDPIFAKVTINGTTGVFYPAHGWNAVQIDGKWSLVDVTRCHGRDKRNGKIEMSWPGNDSLFLAPAADVIYKYFPDDPRWQLLARPISRAEQEALPLLGMAAARHGIEVVKPTGPVLNIDDRAQIVLKVPASSDVIVEAVLISKRERVEGSYILAQRQGETAEVTANAPSSGTFTLRVTACKAGRKVEEAETVAEYRLVAKKGEAGLLPQLTELFPERKCYLHGPLTGVLEAGKPIPFKIAVPGVKNVCVRTGEKITELQGKDGVFSGDVTVQPGDVVLAAAFESTRFEVLVVYKAR
jgi:transglutaminase-like putative cysteine protease